MRLRVLTALLALPGCIAIVVEPSGDAGALDVDAGTVVIDAGSDAGSFDAGFDAGRSDPPDAAITRTWATSLPLDQWTPIPNTAFLPWAKDGGIPGPESSYRGSAPFGSIVNAFSDPAVDARGRFHFYGGGHGDGTCNAVVRLDPTDFSYSLVGAPTPPSAYLPMYLQTTQPITYPSGVPFAGWFLPASQLPDPADAMHRAPALARVSTHMYAAAAMRGSVVHYFYLTYGEFDTATGTWSGQNVDLGAQLPRYRQQYGTVPLQQGTVAIYDSVTDRFFVTLNPGDAGGGWRNGILTFNPTTKMIERVDEVPAALGGPMGNSFNIARVGRELFIFSKTGNYGQPQVSNQGFTYHLDTHVYRRFVLEGDTAASTFPFSVVQETIPSVVDGTKIHRWNYAPSTRDLILTVDTTPVRGTGTEMDPLVFRQTQRRVTGTFTGQAGYEVMFVYSRFVWDEGCRCALVLPRADSPWYALKLSP